MFFHLMGYMAQWGKLSHINEVNLINFIKILIVVITFEESTLMTISFKNLGKETNLL